MPEPDLRIYFRGLVVPGIQKPQFVGESIYSPVHLLHALEQLCLQFELAISAEVEIFARRLNKHVRAVSKETIVGERMSSSFNLSEIVDSNPDSTQAYAMEVAKRRKHIQLDQILKRQVRWIGSHDGWPELFASVGHIARATRPGSHRRYRSPDDPRDFGWCVCGDFSGVHAAVNVHHRGDSKPAWFIRPATGCHGLSSNRLL